MLQPERVDELLAVMPADDTDRRSNAGKQWHQQFIASAGARCIVSAADFDLAQAMAAAMSAHPIAAGLLADCPLREASAAARRDVVTDLVRKARVDALAADYRVLLDLKTTPDAREPAFARSASVRLSHAGRPASMACYALAGCAAAAWIAVESSTAAWRAGLGAPARSCWASATMAERALAAIAVASKTGARPAMRP